MKSTNRRHEEPELLEKMIAHCGKCKHCGQVVKMRRDLSNAELRPDWCFCILCGQRYYMVIEDLGAWEIEQWRQKSERRD